MTGRKRRPNHCTAALPRVTLLLFKIHVLSAEATAAAAAAAEKGISSQQMESLCVSDRMCSHRARRGVRKFCI